MNVVIISTFKPFLEAFKTEQINAIKSWKKLRCNPKIVIVGDDMGVKEVCKSENLIHHPEVKKNGRGTPLVGDIFEQGWKYANDDDICVFVNGDIILTNSLCDGLERFVKQYPNHKNLKYLITAKRFDWYNFKKVNFENPNWEKEINKGMKGKYSLPTAGDIFIHRKNTLKIPFSGIAKMSYDSWIMGHSIKNFDVTINATSVIKIYHQYGKWYQDKKVCPRLTKTNEMLKNQERFREILKKEGITKKKVTDCKITW
jgi:hypothetical protein